MRYRYIDVRIWGDEKFRSLSPLQPSAQALFLYLLTNPNTTSIPGLYRAGPAAMAEELGWFIEDFKGAFDELMLQGLAKADLISRVIFIPNAIKYNKPQSPNVIRSWASHWDEIPECELKNLAYQALKTFVEDMGQAFGEAFDETIGKPSLKTMPNQEQEQEQDQDQEKKTKIVVNLPFDPQVLEVFKFWQSVMDHPNAKLDAKRKKKIQAALNSGYPVDKLKQAITGCANTPFNMGKNENKQRYDGIDLIFRDADRIERFIQNASANGSESSLNLKVNQIDQISEGAI
ncbi:MAG: hypothetical protein HYX61_12630 [Gammaproteobacteria bacterium]|jgi:hypothetical protein|nr:hypothetical protein [Gammaproteobacteria bacterium]